jgi:hypothetical protein
MLVAFTAYVCSYFLFTYGFKYGEVELKGKQRALTLGSGTFVVVWAAVWILLSTLNPY